MSLMVAISGPPSSGKTTSLERLKAEFGKRALFVPEVPRFLMKHMNLRPDFVDPVANARFQRSVFDTQRVLEDAAHKQKITDGAEIVITDRATVDIAVYMAEGADEFERVCGIPLHAEFERYRRMIYLAPVPPSLYVNDAERKESHDHALRLGEALHRVLAKHPDLKIVEGTDWDVRYSLIRQHILELL